MSCRDCTFSYSITKDIVSSIIFSTKNGKDENGEINDSRMIIRISCIYVYSYTIENFALTDRGIREAVAVEGGELVEITEIEVGQPKYNNLT